MHVISSIFIQVSHVASYIQDICVKQYYMRTLFFYVRATFLIPYILAVIAFTFFVKTSRCKAVHVIGFLLLLLPGAELPSWKFWPSQRPLSLFPRSWTQVIQFLIFIWQMSCVMLSSHLYLGLPCDLLVRGFQLNIFLTVLVSGILCMWPNQLSLWALMWLIIFLCFISLSNSSLVLTCNWIYDAQR